MDRRDFLKISAIAPTLSLPQTPVKADGPMELKTRSWWLGQLHKMVFPVWQNLANGSLRANMPVETRLGNPLNRKKVSHLEAVGRSFLGLAPWVALQDSQLNDAEEIKLHNQYKQLLNKGLEQIFNSKSPDFMLFEGDNQILVDAAFLAYGLLMPGAWESIFLNLSEKTKESLVEAWLLTRKIKPYQNNWLLFSAMVELALQKAGEQIQEEVIETAYKQHNLWYKGDGVYGDGPDYHADYYNSYVIHPMLDVLCANSNLVSDGFKAVQRARSNRYLDIQFRSINQDGSFPVLGRSICYRSGAFHHLAFKALRNEYPVYSNPASARLGLERVIEKTLSNGSYGQEGWLLLGLVGHQPMLAEDYISTGSLYLASAAFLPLGLPPIHPFWTGQDQDGKPLPLILPSDAFTANFNVIDKAYKE